MIFIFNDNLQSLKYDYINLLLKNNMMPDMNEIKKMCDKRETIYNKNEIIKDYVKNIEKIEVETEQKERNI